MATLVSPGVQVSVVDESIGVGAGQGTVPFILIATEENKTLPDGTGTAPGTLKQNAGALYSITSQRELLQTFGDPIFREFSGTALNGDPTNEYGLLAAYSYLGLANRAFIVRADVDTAQLQPDINEPTSPPDNGTVWVDLNNTTFGVFGYDATLGIASWISQGVKYVFATTADDTVGADGEYAIVTTATGINVVLKTASVWAVLSTGIADFTYISNSIWPTLKNDGAALLSGDHWIKTSAASSGVSFSVKEYSSALGQWVTLTTPAFTDTVDNANAITEAGDVKASAFYDIALKDGDLYIYTNSIGSDFEIRKYNASTTAWVAQTGYTVSNTAPVNGPADGSYWYNADVGLDGNGLSTVDIMVVDNSGGSNLWGNIALPGFHYDPVLYAGTGTRDSAFDETGYLFLISSDPVDIFGGSPKVVDGDHWVDTDQIDDYPVIFVRKAGAWVQVDNADQTSNMGIIFVDVRPEPAYDSNGDGSIDTNVAPDTDAPDADAYPDGFLVWNTRFSTRNVKAWDKDAGESNLNSRAETGRWKNVSGNKNDGSPIMGSGAQKQMVVEAMQSDLIENEQIRAESIFFNLLACPGYPETINEMITLNTDRKETGFIIGDTPFTLAPTGTALQEWTTNANGATGDGEVGLVSANNYLGVYYPSGLSSNLDGVDVVVPPSHILLRTIGYSDQVSYPWFAPAGLQRGIVTNAASVGYIDDEGEYRPVELNQGLRDVLYLNKVNPIRFVPNSGLVVWGQKTRSPIDTSALSRINVARLVNFLRYQSDTLAQPFLFEPNDDQTRKTVTDTFDRFMAEIVTLRGITDFLVVCDESNNTPARIDRNELWVDVVIQPTRAIEFIYIPIRIRNTGTDLSI